MRMVRGQWGSDGGCLNCEEKWGICWKPGCSLGSFKTVSCTMVEHFGLKSVIVTIYNHTSRTFPAYKPLYSVNNMSGSEFTTKLKENIRNMFGV